MKVFVLNKHGNPLMPTTPRKARLLLKEKKAEIVSHAPFTIGLVYGSSGYKQEVKLGMDEGRRQIRKQRYPIQPHDVVKYNGKFYRAGGIQNKGKYLKMSDGTANLVKNLKNIEVVFHQKALVLLYE